MIIALSFLVQTVPLARPQPVLLNASSSKEASEAINSYVRCLDGAILERSATRDEQDISAKARDVSAACLDRKATAVQLEIAEYEKWPDLTGPHSPLAAALRVVESYDADVE